MIYMKDSQTSPSALIKVDEHSGVPLFGLDFLGIVDRGTNVLEIKPITICNLRCKYCFVASGDYHKNFYTEAGYLLEWIMRAIAIKQSSEIEIHIAPYGEVLLYPQLEVLIRGLRKLPEVKVISAQTNGLLLTPAKIKLLDEWGVDRLNISLNSMDAGECANYCGVARYDLDHLLAMMDLVLESSMELIIAPVWFMGKNDQGIFDIIDLVKAKEKEKAGYTWPKLRLGIQNYLTYRTGRKIGHVRSKEFRYFYARLKKMEKEHGLKLKLGPRDFGIVKTPAVQQPVGIGETHPVDIVCKGRWDTEYIARLTPDWAVKVFTKHNLSPGDRVKVKFIKSSLTGNLLTARY